ncbi:hypothetical protein B0H16DRAFT_1572596 [Mycena metata]|uniref:Uncharacterized protein n=1 Tax=Mycena metata TaxID=1033252 RepID=A0AAD7MXP4_9AGAR|nr:hypothetical protein B0H16DRAFT_1572596 [Mycena metata]
MTHLFRAAEMGTEGFTGKGRRAVASVDLRYVSNIVISTPPQWIISIFLRRPFLVRKYSSSAVSKFSVSSFSPYCRITRPPPSPCSVPLDVALPVGAGARYRSRNRADMVAPLAPHSAAIPATLRMPWGRPTCATHSSRTGSGCIEYSGGSRRSRVREVPIDLPACPLASADVPAPAVVRICLRRSATLAGSHTGPGAGYWHP